MTVTGLLIRRHLRKRPGQTLAIAVLTLLAAMLANTGMLLLLDYGENVDRKAAEWNSPDVMAVVGTSPAIETLEQVLTADPNVTDIELSPAVTAAATLDYGGVDMYSAVAFVDIDAQPRLGQFTQISEHPIDVANPVWAPSVLAASGNYALGDAITFDTPTGSSTFHIQCFIEDLYGGVPGWGLLTLGVPDLDVQAPGFAPTTLVKVNATNPLEASQALSAAIKVVNQQLPPQQELVAWWQHDMSVLKSGAMMSASIYVAILAALAVIAVSVAAVVIRFVLRNLLATDITAIGALRAAGFTTAGIVGSLVAPYALLTAVASLAGVGLSYLLMPAVETSFHAQNGLTWEAEFSPTAAALTSVATLCLVLTVAGLAAARVRKTTTVAALRGGIATHSFRRTYLPLESTRGSRNVLLGLKTALQQVPQNATIVLTISATALAAVFGIGMGRNLLGDSDKATELLAGKLEDVSAVVKLDADPDQILAGIAALPEVTDAYFATTTTHNVDGLSIGFQVSPDPDAHATDPV
ncbi:MAG: ABC transporter permease, partial [Rhodococcus sp.]|nr:ABC transporter permease [Rhodococcus sp. (in: high G+C Gram-positive bacteria)]